MRFILVCHVHFWAFVFTLCALYVSVKLIILKALFCAELLPSATDSKSKVES